MNKINLQSWIPAQGDNINWALIEREYDFHKDMLLCPQEPTFHAEGDVWTHTKMVCDSLVSDAKWQNLSEEDRFITFFSALLHDIGKPMTTKTENGIITSKGHSKIGAQDARIWLWHQNTDFKAREAICDIISTHQLPFFLYTKENKELIARKISWTSNWDNLILVARHDMIGRTYNNKAKVIEDIDFLDLWLEDSQLKHAAYADSHTRLKYLSSPSSIDPSYPIFKESGRSKVIMLCGLPGSGKDSYIRDFNAGKEEPTPVVSLDEERKILKIKPGEDSGPAVHAATDKMKNYLRQGKEFIFNATNLSSTIRGKSLDLFHNYGASVHIVYLEKTYENLIQSDKERETSVGLKVIESMLFKWEPPTCLEAESVEYIMLQNQKFKKKLSK